VQPTHPCPRRVGVRHDGPMSYFTAVLAASAADTRSWTSVDVDLEDVADVDELADALGEGAADGGLGDDAPVLAVLEREDEFFALARLGVEGLRVFVSDLDALRTSRYAQLVVDVVPAGEPPEPEPAGEEDPDAEEDEDQDDDAAARARIAGPSWAGDATLLADLGVSAEDLVDASESHDPATALASVGERVGFVDLLDALR
jgi:putative tRNA adenosine deaminase-associated protein